MGGVKGICNASVVDTSITHHSKRPRLNRGLSSAWSCFCCSEFCACPVWQATDSQVKGFLMAKACWNSGMLQWKQRRSFPIIAPAGIMLSSPELRQPTKISIMSLGNMTPRVSLAVFIDTPFTLSWLGKKCRDAPSVRPSFQLWHLRWQRFRQADSLLPFFDSNHLFEHHQVSLHDHGWHMTIDPADYASVEYAVKVLESAWGRD